MQRKNNKWIFIAWNIFYVRISNWSILLGEKWDLSWSKPIWNFKSPIHFLPNIFVVIRKCQPNWYILWNSFWTQNIQLFGVFIETHFFVLFFVVQMKLTVMPHLIEHSCWICRITWTWLRPSPTNERISRMFLNNNSIFVCVETCLNWT